MDGSSATGEVARGRTVASESNAIDDTRTEMVRSDGADGDFYGKVVANYQARQRVKPGITGLAQMLGWRGPTDTHAQIEQRVANDLRYISIRSFFQDLLIRVRTAFTLFGRNAQ
jgi:lipopolysaccharide/colanic/teichoic acid biosynthesis glycosyltransferase